LHWALQFSQSPSLNQLLSYVPSSNYSKDCQWLPMVPRNSSLLLANSTGSGETTMQKMHLDGPQMGCYATPPKPSSSSQRDASASVSWTPLEDPVEQSLLKYFTTYTAVQLSGYFSSHFWEQRVMRAISEPSVRHRVIAIGAAHQNFVARHENRDKEPDPSAEASAFHQYTTAISHLYQ
jgi:hypothetical protein